MGTDNWKLAEIQVRPRTAKAISPASAYVNNSGMNKAKSSIDKARSNLERQIQREMPNSHRPINKETIVAIALKELHLKVQGLLDDYRELRRRYYKEMMLNAPSLGKLNELQKGIYMIEDYLDDSYYNEDDQSIKKIFKIAVDSYEKIDHQEHMKWGRI